MLEIQIQRQNKWTSAENSHFQLMMITVNFPLNQQCGSASVNKQQLSLQQLFHFQKYMQFLPHPVLETQGQNL